MPGNYRIRMLLAGVVLLAAVSTSYAPPGFRPPPRPPAFRPAPRPIHVPEFHPGPNIGGARGPNMGGLRPGTNRAGFRPVTQFRDLVGTRPADALKSLRTFRHELSPQQQLALARMGVRALAERVLRAPDARVALNEVRVARTGQGMGPNFERTLRAMEAHLQQRILVKSLKAIIRSGEEGRWARAGEEAQAQLRQAAPAPEGKKVLDEVVQVGKQAESMARLETALKTVDWNRPADVATALQKVGLDHLPARLQAPLRSLRGLAELRVESARPWREAPDVAGLKQKVASLRAAGCDGHLADAVLLDLGAKALLDGFPAEARALLPDHAPAGHAGSVLRDLKALVLGKGEVHTAVVRQAVEARAGEGREPPPGLKPLLPEGPAAGWRPRVSESARADLPPLEKAAAQIEKPLRQRVENTQPMHWFVLEWRKATALHHVHQLHRHVVQPAGDDDKEIKELEAKMGRKLTEAEKVLARQMRREGKNQADIMAALREVDLAAKAPPPPAEREVEPDDEP
jgi:hypothetical protein